MKRHAWKYERWDREDGPSPRSPKRFARPRSRNAREALDAPIPSARVESVAKILKETYRNTPGPIMGKPKWAHVALKFGWLTRNAFYAVKNVQVGWFEGISKMLYRESPLFGLLEKDTNFGVCLDG